MTEVLKFLCRLIPAITLIFSGFVKAIDPSGGAIMIEDYLVAFHMQWLLPMAMPLSILQAAVEFLLGFYLLLGLYTRVVIPLVIIIMSFFTLLTLYIAIFNPVSNCGCFGEAITLTNWQTFWKNVIVMVFCFGLYYYRKQLKSATGWRAHFTAVALLAYILWLSVYCINNLPIIDFRPFKTGTHIHSLMVAPQGAEMPEYETTFTLERDGVRQTFSVDEYPYEDTTWVFIDSETKVVSEGFIPPLQTFSLLDNEMGDVTNEIVNHAGAVFLMIAPRLEKANTKNIMHLSEMAEMARQKNIPFYCITASGDNETSKFDIEHKTVFNYLHTDESTLKTIVRSNPGLVVLYNGTVISKWHNNKLPTIDIINNPLAYSLTKNNKSKTTFLIWAHILGLIILSSIVITCKTNKQ